MGAVYRGTHTKTGMLAAVKVITAPQHGHGGASNPNERFEREAEILQQFRHPNIVRFLAVGRSKGIRYIAMEFVDGETLDHLLADHQTIEWPKAVDICCQICSALEYAHEKGIVHRDLKPSNLMFTSSGQVKLTDFGIAKDLDATALTAPGKTVGTAAYMAPEQIRGTTQISHKIDLYALGCVFYQMLTGELPFQGNNSASLMSGHLNEPAPRVSKKCPQIPRVLDDLILRLMAKDPTQRPWDATAVSQELHALQVMLARGEPIKMVFGSAYVSDPTLRASLSAQYPAESEPQQAASQLPNSSKPSQTSGSGVNSKTQSRVKKKKVSQPFWTRLNLSSLTLLGGAVSLLALIIYLLQPPTADQLYARALPLIESDDPVQWQDADRRYLTEIERRFPTDPRVQNFQAIRDRILLNKCRGRERLLTSISKPQNDAEKAYLETLKRADDAEKQGFEDEAGLTWNRLAQNYEKAMKTTTPEERNTIRGWALLATEKASTLLNKVGQNTQAARSRLLEAETAEANGQDDFGAERRRSLIRDFSQYPYLGEILEAAKAGLSDQEIAK